MTMGQRIAEERKKLNLSQEALGEKMGVSRQAISKWESDGAVPDVDKLIALSKLFGVTVGWLLGVEEESQEASSEAFTEQQLKLVEEIVKRYQPQPQIVEVEKKPKHRVLKAAAALAVGIVLWYAWQDLNWQLEKNTNSTNNLNGSNYSIQSQLNSLSNRMDELLAGEQLLSEYEATAVAWNDSTGADVTFKMVPKAWTDTDTGWVTVCHEGVEIGTWPCTSQQTIWTATIPLEARDNYEYYYVVEHADGVREQQVMVTGLADIAHGLQGTYTVNAETQMSDRTLSFSSFSISLVPPSISPSEPPNISQVDWVVFFNGEECCREPMFSQMELEDRNNLSGSGSGLHQFVVPKYKNGDTVTLVVEVNYTDGSTRLVEVVSYVRRNDWCWT